MISRIFGKIVDICTEKRFEIVEIATVSGLVYEVLIPLGVSETWSKGENIELFTYLHVRENEMTLYGFRDMMEKQLFKKLIAISGIGPKVAISILSMYNFEQLKTILSSNDVSALSKVSGLGQKGAKKIVLELQGILVGDIENNSDNWSSAMIKELKAVLSQLGFTGQDLTSLLDKADKIVATGKITDMSELVELVLSEDDTK